MPILTVSEYQKIFVGERFEPENCSVTKRQATQLEAISHQYERQYKAPIFRHGSRGCLVAQNYVGVIQIGDVGVEVLPKIDGLKDQAQVRQNLVGMLTSVFDISLLEGEVAQLGTQKFGILDVIIRLFCDHLWNALRRGMVRRYESREDNLPLLRGKLDFSRQSKENASRPYLLACRFEEFVEDTPINWILKAALRKLVRVARHPATQRQTTELLFCFQDVSDCAVSSLPWQKVQTDRLTMRYAPLLKLARLFLTNQPPDVTSGKNQGFSILFDMNALFEEYIGRVCQRVFSSDGMRVTLQGPKRHLVLDEFGRPAFALKPDIVAQRESGVVWIADTKWKRLDTKKLRDGVLQADMYQMFAYARQYNSHDVVLLYPHHRELGATGGMRLTYAIDTAQGTGLHQRIRVATVDLQNLKSVPSQLRAIFV